MSLDELAVYLKLTPEFGGTRFGPFEGLEVRLGSDPDRCHIVLPESLGVVKEHARVIRQGPTNLIIAPADRTASIFLWKPRARRGEHITTPTAIRPGDSFSLVTQNGPRFLVELDELPEEIKKEREEAARRVGVGRRRLSAKSMGSEVKRQAWTQLLVMGPMQLLQRAITFVKSGAIYQPRNIILGVTLLGGWVFGGVSMCSSRSKTKQLGTVTQRYEECEQQLGYAGDQKDKNIADWTFSELAGQVSRSLRLEAALKEDVELRKLVEKEARLAMADNTSYAWLIENSRQVTDFKRWYELVSKSETLNEDVKKLVPWLGAHPRMTARSWQEFEDSSGEYVCGRGPLRMTYRQAISLGMQAQPDAYHAGRSSKPLEDKETVEKMLFKSMDLANVSRPEDSIESTYDAVDQGYCVHIVGDDDREQDTRLIRRIEYHLGDEAPNTPDPSMTHATTARIAKYWVADLQRVDFERRVEDAGVDFTDNANVTSVTLSQMDSAGQWALKRTARTIAQSIVLPCKAKLDAEDEKEMEAIFGEEGLPQDIPCLILSYKLGADRS